MKNLGSFKIGKKKYVRNKRTGEAWREGSFFNRKTKRGGGVFADGWMSQDRHERNKKRE